MLAREYCDKNKKCKKPVIVGHHMLSGMTKPKVTVDASEVAALTDKEQKNMEIENKMSKSNPLSAIFMEDSVAEVNKKVDKAYCPPGLEFENKNRNPILDYCENIIIPSYGYIEIIRKEENGGNVTYKTYEELKTDYCDFKLHPGDLKTAVALAIN